MTWIVRWDERARKELRKLDKKLQKDVLDYFRDRIVTEDDPRRFGKALSHGLGGLWRYRIQNCRLVFQNQDETLIVLVIKVGDRKEIYK